MRFGICTSVDRSAEVKAAGWDFVEESVQNFLRGRVADDQWDGLARLAGAPLGVEAANVLVPAALKITGPDADLNKLRPYMATVLGRAGRTGVRTLVFGSGGARNVPEGFDRRTAREQILTFVRSALDEARRHGVTIVLEHLNRRECNIINSLAEAMTYVREVDHPNFACLVDSFHFWEEDEPLSSLREAMPWIRHVHVADKGSRVAPGQSGESDYRALFGVLKQGEYAGPISVEALGFNDIAGAGPAVLEFLKQQWNQA
jgi:sugar phosphate isomerase/epimerase